MFPESDPLHRPEDEHDPTYGEEKPEQEKESVDADASSDDQLLSDPIIDAIYLRRMERLGLTPEQMEKEKKLMKQAQKPRGKWHGHVLFQKTTRRRMKTIDVQRKGGVKDCYEASMIPDQAILAVQAGEVDKAEDLLRKGKGGMLHLFDVRPVRYGRYHKQQTESVAEQLSRQIEEGRKRRKHTPHGKKSPAIYEGSVLTPQSKEDQTVLAWATWTRSLIENVMNRSPQNDESVAEIARLLEKEIALDQGLRIEQPYGDILLFDTLNARVPGAASVLFRRLLPTWKKLGYKRVLLYRHKILQCVEPGGDRRTGKPVGNNDASERFFRGRGMREIGTALSDVYAIREIGDRKIRVASTEGWMMGSIDKMEKLARKIHGREKKKFPRP